MKKTVFALITIIIIAASLAGCSTADYIDEAKNDISSSLGISSEDIDISSERVSKSDMTNSHSIMAAMILSNAGKDSDLSGYDDVYLCDVSINNSDTSGKIVIIVKDNEATIIIPENLKDQLA